MTTTSLLATPRIATPQQQRAALLGMRAAQLEEVRTFCCRHGDITDEPIGTCSYRMGCDRDDREYAGDCVEGELERLRLDDRAAWKAAQAMREAKRREMGEQRRSDDIRARGGE